MIRADDTREDFDDLPILEEMRASLDGAYARDEADAQRAATRRPWWRPRLGGGSRRVVVALVALGVVVPSAVATRPIWAPTAPGLGAGGPGGATYGVVLAEGAGPSTRWQLSAFVRQGIPCLQLNTGASGGFCAPPGVPISPSLHREAGDQYFPGATSPRIVRVAVYPRPGAPATVVPTRVPDPEKLRRFKVPATFRYYVARVDGPVDPERYVVVGYDAGGREIARWSRANP